MWNGLGEKSPPEGQRFHLGSAMHDTSCFHALCENTSSMNSLFLVSMGMRFVPLMAERPWALNSQ